MANVCRTDIIIKASKKAIDNFSERFDKCVDGPYPNIENDSPHIIDEFGDMRMLADYVSEIFEK